MPMKDRDETLPKEWGEMTQAQRVEYTRTRYYGQPFIIHSDCIELPERGIYIYSELLDDRE